MGTYHLHGDCEECQMFGAIAEYTVWVPSTDAITVNPEVNVCTACIDPARRRLESEPYATGFAHIDPLTYGPKDGAA